jgi:hypothetical protein
MTGWLERPETVVGRKCRSARVAAALFVSLACHVSVAWAQSAKAYTIELHAGGAFGSSPTTGSGGLPGPGVTFVPFGGTTTTTRLVPSWAFGDGTALFNSVASASGLAGRIVPLDAVLTSRSTRQISGSSVGGRLTRRLSPRLDVEATFDLSFRRSEFTSAVRAAVEATRASYQAAFSEFLSQTPNIFTNPAVGVTTTFSDHTGHEAMGCVALNLHLGSGAWAPYVTGGGGFVVGGGTLPSFTVTGDYQFAVNGSPFHQTDYVTVSQTSGVRPLALVGAGVSRDFTSTWGMRADVRLYITSGATATELEAHNTSTTNGRESVFSPATSSLALNFSGVTQAPSSLNGSTRMTTFTPGLRVTGTLDIGILFRF